jgi:small neutral amino acid transporter SnatA (MarC family)
MSRASLYTILLILVLLFGGVIFLATWDIPAPPGGIEIIVPNDRFPK